MTYKERAKKLLGMAGVQVRPIANTRPINLTKCSNMDPVAAVYRGETRNVIVRVPLAECLHFNLMAFPSDVHSVSPLVRTLKEYASGSCRTYSGSQLERYYGTCRPRNAAEYLGLDAPAHRRLLDMPPAGAPRFWRADEPDLNVVRRMEDIAAENRLHGMSLTLADGDQFYGPVTQNKGLLEFKRLSTVFESIRKSGFVVDRNGINNISAICLHWGEKKSWRCMVASSGHHRIAALAALGYEQVDLQILPEGLGGIVRREDAEFWPTVRQGFLSKQEAVEIFDRVFAGKQPAVAKKWASSGV